MTKVRLTKEFSFEAAHLLEGYDVRAAKYTAIRTGCS